PDRSSTGLVRPDWGRRGQTLAEVAITMPLLIIMVIGTLQFGWVIYQDHVAVKVAREAANMISRQVTFDAVETAIKNSQLSPGGSFDSNAHLILSVVRLGTGGSNNGLPIISQRHSIGGLSGSSPTRNPGPRP